MNPLYAITPIDGREILYLVIWMISNRNNLVN